MTTTLMGDFALICEVEDKDLLNELLREYSEGICWHLLGIRKNSFLIGFPRKLYNKINEFNRGNPTQDYFYQQFWGVYLDSDGEPINKFADFLKENEGFNSLIHNNFIRFTRNEKAEEEKIKDMNNKIKLLQEIGDCYMKCRYCEKDIKLPKDFKLRDRIKCSCKEGSKWTTTITEDSELSKVIILKQEIEKKKRRFWKDC